MDPCSSVTAFLSSPTPTALNLLVKIIVGLRIIKEKTDEIYTQNIYHPSRQWKNLHKFSSSLCDASSPSHDVTHGQRISDDDGDDCDDCDDDDCKQMLSEC